MKEPFSRYALWLEDRAEPLINEFGSLLAEAKVVLPNQGTLVCTFDGRRVRLTRRSIDQFTTLVSSADLDKVKGRKHLDLEANIILTAAPKMLGAIERQERRSRQLIHNLKSLTAKTSQELFALFEQHRMLDEPRAAAAYVADEVAKDPGAVARAVVEVLKHQAAQKAEYSAFEKLSGRSAVLRKESHDVHRVLMNVFYLFFAKFLDRKVRATVAQTREKAFFDYDSIHACVYYLVENAAKYTCANSALNVLVSRGGDGLVDITFDMESLQIAEDEVGKIFNEGFSGRGAVSQDLAGAGLGLFLAAAMARINGGRLSHIAGKATRAGYARNTFILTLPAAQN